MHEVQIPFLLPLSGCFYFGEEGKETQTVSFTEEHERVCVDVKYLFCVPPQA